MASDVGEKLGEQDAVEASARGYFRKKVVANTVEWCC